MASDFSYQIPDLLQEHDWLVRLSRRLVAGEAEADDLVQETMVRALRAPSARSVRGAVAALAWLSTAARNVLRDGLRTGERRRRREEAAAHPEAVDGGVAALDRAELRERLARFVMELDEPSRTAVVLRFYEGLDASGIARRTDASSAHVVRRRVRRGVAQLRERLDREERKEGRSSWRSIAVVLARSEETAPVRAAAAAEAWGWGGLAAVAASSVALLVAFTTLRPYESPGANERHVALAEPQAEHVADLAPVASERRSVVPAAGDEPQAAFVGPTTGIRLVDEITGAPVDGVRWYVIATGRHDDGRKPGALSGATSNPTPLAHGVSDASGVVRFAHPEHELVHLVTARTDVYARGSWPIDVALAFSDPPELRLRRGGTVEGRFVDQFGAPYAGLKVLSATFDERPLLLGTSDAEGRFRFDRLADMPRNYEPDPTGLVQPRRTNPTYYLPLPPSWYEAQLADFHWAEMANQRGFEVGGASFTDVGDIEVRRPFRVTGQVIDAWGRPVAKALVSTREDEVRSVLGERGPAANLRHKGSLPWRGDWLPRQGATVTGESGRFSLEFHDFDEKKAMKRLAVLSPGGGRALIELDLPRGHVEVDPVEVTIAKDGVLALRFREASTGAPPTPSREYPDDVLVRILEDRESGMRAFRERATEIEAGGVAYLPRSIFSSPSSRIEVDVAGYRPVPMIVTRGTWAYEVEVEELPVVELALRFRGEGARPQQRAEIQVSARRHVKKLASGRPRYEDRRSIYRWGFTAHDVLRVPIDPDHPIRVWVRPLGSPTERLAKRKTYGPFEWSGPTRTIDVEVAPWVDQEAR